jgi:hypothetical protein
MPSLIINPYVTLDDKPIEVGQLYWTYEIPEEDNPVQVLDPVHRIGCIRYENEINRNTFTIQGGILRAKCGCDGWVETQTASGGRVSLDGSRMYKSELVFLVQRVRG